MKHSHLQTPRQLRDGIWTAGYVSAPETVVPTMERLGGIALAIVIGIAGGVLLVHALAGSVA
jgi:hypothetical protein